MRWDVSAVFIITGGFLITLAFGLYNAYLYGWSGKIPLPFPLQISNLFLSVALVVVLTTSIILNNRKKCEYV